MAAGDDIIVLTLAIIGSFNVFDLVYTMTYGGPGRADQLRRRGCTSTPSIWPRRARRAIAWVIAAISLIVTVPYIRMMARR